MGINHLANVPTAIRLPDLLKIKIIFLSGLLSARNILDPQVKVSLVTFIKVPT